jgi:hypothetical protein
LLQRSAEEAGLDAGNLRGLQDITKPRLFPDFEWHSSGRIGHEQPPTPVPPSQQPVPSKRAKESMVYLINKGREMQQWFQESPFYVRPSQEVDVARYNKRPRPLEPDAHVAAFVGKTADPRYIPTDLLQDKASKTVVNDVDGDEGLPKRVLTLEELAAEEQRKKNISKTAGEEGEDQDGELSDTQELEEEDEEEVADYTQDYYASDDESNGSVGDEAVF